MSRLSWYCLLTSPLRPGRKCSPRRCCCRHKHGAALAVAVLRPPEHTVWSCCARLTSACQKVCAGCDAVCSAALLPTSCPSLQLREAPATADANSEARLLLWDAQRSSPIPASRGLCAGYTETCSLALWSPNRASPPLRGAPAADDASSAGQPLLWKAQRSEATSAACGDSSRGPPLLAVVAGSKRGTTEDLQTLLQMPRAIGRLPAWPRFATSPPGSPTQQTRNTER